MPRKIHADNTSEIEAALISAQVAGRVHEHNALLNNRVKRNILLTRFVRQNNRQNRYP